MRKLLAALVLFPGVAFADGWQTAPGVATPRANTTPGVPMERANVTRFGNVQFTEVGPDGTVGEQPRLVAPVNSNPSVPTATSTTILAANATRNGYRIQNNTAANICCSESGGTLTGIAPTAANPCTVLAAGTSLTSLSNVVTTTAITCYQASGGTVETISAVQW